MDIEQIKKLQGQITPKEVQRLHDLAKSLPENALIVEIGSYTGKSSVAIASGMPKSATLMCIDPWLQLHRDTEQGYETMETVKTHSDRTAEYHPRVIQVIGFPLEVAKFIPNIPSEIDMLSIDSVKKYDQIKAIWDVWLPKVKKGGIVASHDYLPDPTHEQYYEGVVRVIEEDVKPITTNHQHIDYTFSGTIR
jgi:predicted O-methyltransferase YrrM